MRSLVAGLVATLVSCLAVAGAPAQTGQAATVQIDNCSAKKSRTGNYSWAYCSIVSQAAAGQTVSVHYKTSLPTYVPIKGVSYSPSSGTRTFTGGGEQIWALKFAFKGKTVAQLVKLLTVKLSNASGATITDATATTKAKTTPGN